MLVIVTICFSYLTDGEVFEQQDNLENSHPVEQREPSPLLQLSPPVSPFVGFASELGGIPDPPTGKLQN